MSITATVEAGKIVLPPGFDWPDGTIVRVDRVEETTPTVWETLKEFDGIATGLPPDFAAQHNHYIHGHPDRNSPTNLQRARVSLLGGNTILAYVV